MTTDDVPEDDPISPDDVRRPIEDAAGLDEIARRAVDAVLTFLQRASALATGVLIFALIACLGGYAIGIAALSDGLRAAWIVLGGIAAIWAIGTVASAIFRLWVVRRGSDLLVDEVRSLIGGDAESERTVIETVESTEGTDDTGVVSLSRQFFSMREVVSGHRSDFRALSMALASITTLPAAMALAVVIGFGFAFLSVIFGLILIF